MGLKTLLKQTFHGDVEDLDYGSLADLIILQPHLGSTAKTDGPEGDPMAFITLIDLQEYAGKVDLSLSTHCPVPIPLAKYSKITSTIIHR